MGTAAAAQVPDARPLGATVATIPEPFGSVQSLRQLPDGRLLVNDPAKRRLLLFDADLKNFTVVADSTNPAATYSGRAAGLIAYRGDSTLFVDPQSLSMLVIDPKGQVGRVMAVPRAEDAMALTGIAFGAAGFDAQGRLVYRAPPRFEFRRTAPGGPAPGQPGFQMPQMPDTSPILRVELATRKVDTVAWLKGYVPKMTPNVNADGRLVGMTSIVNPLPQVDDWAVLSDGTVAILRGREFRMDIVGADGKLVTGPKIPHDWQRMSDEEKVAYLDSTKTAQDKMRAQMQKRIDSLGGMEKVMASGNAAQILGGPPGGGGGAPMISIRVGGPDGAAPPRRGQGPNGGNGTAGNSVQLAAPEYVPASELPDYKPPFAMGAARADADGHVWVRLIATKPMPGPVYDVIDGTGKLVDRVVLPAGAAIAGFGPGVVYLATRDQDGTHLKKVAVK